MSPVLKGMHWRGVCNKMGRTTRCHHGDDLAEEVVRNVKIYTRGHIMDITMCIHVVVTSKLHDQGNIKVTEKSAGEKNCFWVIGIVV